jgi:MFS family permease
LGRVRSVHHTDAEGLAALLRPRNDLLVREGRVVDDGDPTATGRALLHAVDGPFADYDRELEWSAASDGSGRIEVHQEVRWRLSFPYWRWLYQPMVRRTVRTGIRPGVRPWWLFPDRLSAPQATVVATMATFNLVAGLLVGLLTQSLTFVSADLGDGSAGQQAAVLATVRIGVVITMSAMVLADRIGRRRIGVGAYTAAAVLSVLAAGAPNLVVFTALQFLARNLATAGLLAVDTITVEEVPAGSRAMASGLGAMAYGLGAGVVVLALPLADLGPWGWRLTFLTSLLTLPVVIRAARHLPESSRFRRLRDEVPTGEGRRIDRRRLLVVGALFFLLNLFVAPSSQLQNDYLRSDRGFSAALITFFVVLTATPAGIGVVLGGRMSDTRGRRSTLLPGLLAIGIGNAAFFALSGPPMWVAAVMTSVLSGLAVASLGVIGPELFPTARRGSARGAVAVLTVSGAVVGLVAAGALVDATGYGTTFAVLAAAPVVAAVLALAVPETRGRELEDINRQR